MKIDPNPSVEAFRQPIASFEQATTAFSDYLDRGSQPTKAEVFGAWGMFGDSVATARTAVDWQAHAGPRLAESKLQSPATLAARPAPQATAPSSASPTASQAEGRAAGAPSATGPQSTAAFHSVLSFLKAASLSSPSVVASIPTATPPPSIDPIDPILAPQTPSAPAGPTLRPAATQAAVNAPLQTAQLSPQPQSPAEVSQAAAPPALPRPSARRQDASILLHGDEAGLEVVAALAAFDPEDQGKLRDRIAEVLDEHGLRLGTLTLNGYPLTDAQLQFLGGPDGARSS